jgi:regulator of protease activity HflC (stomatin/prohibitin superfamily)
MGVPQNYAKFESRTDESLANEWYPRDDQYFASKWGFRWTPQSSAPAVPAYAPLEAFSPVWSVLETLLIVSWVSGLLIYAIIMIMVSRSGGIDALWVMLHRHIGLVLGWLSSVRSWFKSTIYAWWSRLMDRKRIWYTLLTVVLLVILLRYALTFNPFIRITRIPYGFVGVDLKRDAIIQPGFYVYSPLRSDYFLSPVLSFDFEIAEATATSQEELGITMDCRVWFKINPSKRLELYRKYGSKDIKLVSSDIVMPAILESIKKIMREQSYKTINTKVDELRALIIQDASKRLWEFGIEIEYISVLDIRLPQEYLKSKEDLLKAENELKLAEAKAQTSSKQSEQKLLQAQNDKKMMIISAEAQAEYNKIVASQTLTNQILELKKLEIEEEKVKKRDGKLSACDGGTQFMSR